MRTNAGTAYQAGIMGSAQAAPANYIALSTSATAPAAADTTLGGELATSGGGLVRAQATYAFTSSGSSTGYYTLTKTFTANSTDGASNTIQKIGVFNASTGGTLVFETVVQNPPTLISGDSIAMTETVTI